MKPGSFITTYSDTDSIALGLTRTNTLLLPRDEKNVPLATKLEAMFTPLLRDDKKEVCKEGGRERDKK